jgi:hypothetical protein
VRSSSRFSSSSDRAFDLGVAKQKLDSPKIAGAPVDQGSLRASERMRSEKSWVQTNAANPLGNEASIWSHCHAAFGTTTTCEQELPEPFVGSLQIIIDRLAGLFGQFKSDWSSGFFCRTVARSAVHPLAATSSTLIATTSQPRSLLVDCKIEHGKVASATFDLKFCPDRPDVFGSQRRLRPGNLALVPRHPRTSPGVQVIRRSENSS